MAGLASGCPGSSKHGVTGTNDGGPSAMAGASGAKGNATAGMGGGNAQTSLSGTLGALGDIKPTVSSFVIANSGEILIYLSSVELDCTQIMVSRWLGSVSPGAQIVEIVVPASKASGTVKAGKGGVAEVNYAEGGKSSAYEKSADSGSVTFTTTTAKGVFEGTLTASYGNPSASVTGVFHAEYCDGGQGY